VLQAQGKAGGVFELLHVVGLDHMLMTHQIVVPPVLMHGKCLYQGLYIHNVSKYGLPDCWKASREGILGRRDVRRFWRSYSWGGGDVRF
jgi:hypothetical protein